MKDGLPSVGQPERKEKEIQELAQCSLGIPCRQLRQAN